MAYYSAQAGYEIVSVSWQILFRVLYARPTGSERASYVEPLPGLSSSLNRVKLPNGEEEAREGQADQFQKASMLGHK